MKYVFADNDYARSVWPDIFRPDLRGIVLWFVATLVIVLFPAIAIANPVDEFPEGAKIISIGGTLTEIVYALGGGDRLIARDTTSTYPAEAQKLPDVGYMRNLSPDGIIKLAGATNAIDGFNGYKLLTDEAIIEARPDLILLMAHSATSTTVDDIYKIPAIETTPAFKNKAIKQMDGLYLLGFGPRTPLAIREVIQTLYKSE